MFNNLEENWGDETYSTEQNLNEIHGSGGLAELIKGDYKKRTIIELVQNGNDQIIKGEEEGVKNELVFELHEEGLLVANGGKPFENDDCEYIRSGKGKNITEEDSSLVGEKGVGFKSVLNLTKSPIFFSKDGISVKFDYEEGMDKLKEKSEKFEEKVKEELEECEFKNPLKFPFKIKNENKYFVDHFDNELKKSIEELYDEFSSVLYLEFKDYDKSQDIKEEFEEFNPHSLLFLTDLAESDQNEKVSSVEQIEFRDKINEEKKIVELSRKKSREKFEVEEEYNKNYEIELYEIIITKNEDNKPDSENWLLYKKNGLQLGIKLKEENGYYIPTPCEDGNFYLYFSTVINTGFSFIVHHNDFSVDISRKHFSEEEENEEALNGIENDIKYIIKFFKAKGHKIEKNKSDGSTRKEEYQKKLTTLPSIFSPSRIEEETNEKEINKKMKSSLKKDIKKAVKSEEGLILSLDVDGEPEFKSPQNILTCCDIKDDTIRDFYFEKIEKRIKKFLKRDVLQKIDDERGYAELNDEYVKKFNKFFKFVIDEADENYKEKNFVFENSKLCDDSKEILRRFLKKNPFNVKKDYTTIRREIKNFFEFMVNSVNKKDKLYNKINEKISLIPVSNDSENGNVIEVFLGSNKDERENQIWFPNENGNNDGELARVEVPTELRKIIGFLDQDIIDENEKIKNHLENFFGLTDFEEEEIIDWINSEMIKTKGGELNKIERDKEKVLLEYVFELFLSLEEKGEIKRENYLKGPVEREKKKVLNIKVPVNDGWEKAEKTIFYNPNRKWPRNINDESWQEDWKNLKNLYQSEEKVGKLDFSKISSILNQSINEDKYKVPKEHVFLAFLRYVGVWDTPPVLKIRMKKEYSDLEEKYLNKYMNEIDNYDEIEDLSKKWIAEYINHVREETDFNIFISSGNIVNADKYGHNKNKIKIEENFIPLFPDKTKKEKSAKSLSYFIFNYWEKIYKDFTATFGCDECEGDEKADNFEDVKNHSTPKTDENKDSLFTFWLRKKEWVYLKNNEVKKPENIWYQLNGKLNNLSDFAITKEKTEYGDKIDDEIFFILCGFKIDYGLSNDNRDNIYYNRGYDLKKLENKYYDNVVNLLNSIKEKNNINVQDFHELHSCAYEIINHLENGGCKLENIVIYDSADDQIRDYRIESISDLNSKIFSISDEKLMVANRYDILTDLTDRLDIIPYEDNEDINFPNVEGEIKHINKFDTYLKEDRINEKSREPKLEDFMKNFFKILEEEKLEDMETSEEEYEIYSIDDKVQISISINPLFDQNFDGKHFLHINKYDNNIYISKKEMNSEQTKEFIRKIREKYYTDLEKYHKDLQKDRVFDMVYDVINWNEDVSKNLKIDSVKAGEKLIKEKGYNKEIVNKYLRDEKKLAIFIMSTFNASEYIQINENFIQDILDDVNEENIQSKDSLWNRIKNNVKSNNIDLDEIKQNVNRPYYIENNRKYLDKLGINSSQKLLEIKELDTMDAISDQIDLINKWKEYESKLYKKIKKRFFEVCDDLNNILKENSKLIGEFLSFIGSDKNRIEKEIKKICEKTEVENQICITNYITKEKENKYYLKVWKQVLEDFELETISTSHSDKNMSKVIVDFIKHDKKNKELKNELYGVDEENKDEKETKYTESDDSDIEISFGKPELDKQTEQYDGHRKSPGFGSSTSKNKNKKVSREDMEPKRKKGKKGEKFIIKAKSVKLALILLVDKEGDGKTDMEDVLKKLIEERYCLNDEKRKKKSDEAIKKDMKKILNRQEVKDKLKDKELTELKNNRKERPKETRDDFIKYLAKGYKNKILNKYKNANKSEKDLQKLFNDICDYEKKENPEFIKKQNEFYNDADFKDLFKIIEEIIDVTELYRGYDVLTYGLNNKLNLIEIKTYYKDSYLFLTEGEFLRAKDSLERDDENYYLYRLTNIDKPEILFIREKIENIIENIKDIKPEGSQDKQKNYVLLSKNDVKFTPGLENLNVGGLIIRMQMKK